MSMMSGSWIARRYRAPLAASFGFLLLAGCNESSDKQAQAPQMPPPAVGVVTAAKRPVTEGTSFIGRVQAINKVDLVARVEGFLKQRNYTEGQEVKAGDLLFVLEKDTYQASVDQAQANLASAQATADNAKLQTDRARELIKNQNVAQSTLDDRIAQEKSSAAAVEQNQAALEQAQINLGYTQIAAPFHDFIRLRRSSPSCDRHRVRDHDRGRAGAAAIPVAQFPDIVPPQVTVTAYFPAPPPRSSNPASPSRSRRRSSASTRCST
jgi:multidrug efflux pump subunit AcrA (membrane-fusion protein)